MTALRLPDQFTPGALGATAATPTCCCCCCCCLASTLATPIILHGALREDLGRVTDTEHNERLESAPARAAATWVLFVFALLVTVFGVLPSIEAAWALVLGGLTLVAASISYLIAARAGSLRPVMAGVRMLTGAIAFGAEVVLGAYMVLAGLYLFIGPVVALACVTWARWVYKR